MPQYVEDTMAVKLKDIAEYLNISVSTVSRVVNNKDRVDEKTRDRVLKALESLQYTPNEAARSLKGKVAKAIGIIIPDISNSFFSMVIKGVEAIGRQKGYSIILCNSDGEMEREAEYAQLLLQKQISGLVIATVGGSTDFYSQYDKRGIPVIFIDNHPKLQENYDFVAINNIQASFELVSHLIRLGHSKIAAITGPLSETTANERLKGWEKALLENNLIIRDEWVGVGGFSKESGYKIMQSILKQDEIPTAVFTANNFLAYGAIQALSDSGLIIPEDVAVVCFDAFDPTGLARPTLTSVIQPAEDIGKIAGELIIKKSKSIKIRMHERVILEHRLVINESCGYKNQFCI